MKVHHLVPRCLCPWLVDHYDLRLQYLWHSLCSASYDKSIASSTVSSPNSAISYLLFELSVSLFSLRSSSSCFRLLLRPHFISVLPSIMWFRRQFQSNMWSLQLAFLRFLACRILLSALTVRNTLFFTLPVQLIFPILLQQNISRLFRYLWSNLRVWTTYKAMLQM